jgi:RNA polymerase sigma factor (sigma-70 family)
MHAGSGAGASTDLCGVDEEALARLANDGSDAAITEYFVRNRARLVAVAGRMGGGVVDAEDLLSEAVTATIARWREGRGPTSHITAYLVRAMRNRLHDEAMSPAARVRPLEAAGEPVAPEHAGHRAVDLSVEEALLRRALRAIPPAQAAVLLASVVDGRRPREMENDFDRPSTSISALLRRAKLRLRREMLAQLMRDHALGEACRRAAAGLPQRVPLRIDDVRGGAAEHLRTCPGCRRAWAAFQLFSTSV